MEKRQKSKILAHSSMLGQKKADISITILVLGVIALCFLAILSFINQNNRQENDFVGSGLIETVKSVALENDFFANKGFSSELKDGFEKTNIKKTDNGLKRTTKISVENDKIIGEYIAEEQNIIKDCKGNFGSFFEKCPKQTISVEYKR